MRERLEQAIIDGAGEVGDPDLPCPRLCICIVFVPVFLLKGTAKYLFSPLSLSVIISLFASLVLSFTLVPVLFKYLMRVDRSHARQDASGPARTPAEPTRHAIRFSARASWVRAAASSVSARSIATLWPGPCRGRGRSAASSCC